MKGIPWLPHLRLFLMLYGPGVAVGRLLYLSGLVLSHSSMPSSLDLWSVTFTPAFSCPEKLPL